MPTWSATFGPNDSYFFNSPHKWSHQGLPGDLVELMGEKDLKDVHEMTLGPDGSWACTFSNNDGSTGIKRNSLPQKLNEWLVPTEGGPLSPNRDIGSLRFTLGPDGSFAAWDKSQSTMWEKLPDTLNAYLKTILDENSSWKPNHGIRDLSLGADGAWVFIGTGGGGHYDLKGKAPELEKFLHDSKDFTAIAGVQLSPFQSDRWCVVFNNGGTWHCTPAESAMRTAWEAFGADWKKAVDAENVPVPKQPVQASSQVQTQPPPQQQQQQQVEQRTVEERHHHSFSRGLAALTPLAAPAVELVKALYSSNDSAQGGQGGQDQKDPNQTILIYQQPVIYQDPNQGYQ